jgi:hypothetical protein
MTTTKASLKVGTTEFRQALKSVHAHHRKAKKADAVAQHRVRLTLANGWLFVSACNEQSTALAKLKTIDDTRGNLWEPEDGPLLVDLQPRHIPLICAWVSSKAVASDIDQLIQLNVDMRPEKETGEIEFEDIGGLFSSGERVTYQFADPHEAFPDVISICDRALAEVSGQSERAKPFVQNGDVLKLFAMASTQYDTDLRIRATGSPDVASGFVVQCGSGFIGTVESRHHGDDGLKTRDKIDHEWRRVLGGGKLSSVAVG